MKFEQLKFFIEIAISKSITTAAENLFVSQSALSRSIKALEEELGVTLLVRSVEGVHLTPTGEALLPYMYEVLDKVEMLKKVSASFSDVAVADALRGDLTVATIPVIADMLVFPALEQMNKQFPEVHVDVKLITFENFDDLLSLHSADVLVSVNINNILDEPLKNCSEHVEVLFSDAYLAVVRKNHSLTRKHIVSLEDVLKYRLVANDNGQDLNIFYSFFTTLDAPLDIVLKSNNWRIISQALKVYDAALITNNLFIQSELKNNGDLDIVPIKNSKGVYFVFYEEEHPKKRLIQAFVEILKQTRLALSKERLL